ncbi:MAG: DUF2795 domain-containing protein [Actinomycetes bacterium]
MAFQITEVQKALKGVDYPAGKDELADHAERNGADRELVDALRGMGKSSFDPPRGAARPPVRGGPRRRPGHPPVRRRRRRPGPGGGWRELRLGREGPRGGQGRVAAIPGARTDW